jgi:YfiH family protein
VFRTDAVVSKVRGLHFLLTFADCVPILFFDRRRGVIGAAHAGWRGTALNIAAAVVHTMHAAFGTEPRDLAVAIGPSIGPCCYAVGTEVMTTFQARGTHPVMAAAGECARLDLWATNEGQLVKCGVPPRSIENLRLCTSCQVSTFFSHRAEQGRTGRFALCVGLP